MKWVDLSFPITTWLGHYQCGDLKGDIFAGVTVSVMLIPQGMAYALIAGVPPVYGLYASIVPQVVYAIFGTSRQLSVGPTAMDALLVATGVSVLTTEGTDTYISFVILLAFFMGVFQFLLGIFRLGFISNLLSKPVISGFMSAAALIIGLNQLKYLLGIKMEKDNRVHEVLSGVWEKIDQTHFPTVLIGIVGIILIKCSKRVHKNLPGALLAVVIGTIAVYLLGLDHNGVTIVGDIPTGLPSFRLPDFSLSRFVALAPLALTMSVIAYMEAFSVAKTLEAKEGYHKIRPNQELVALGACNILGSLFQSFPVTGGISRSMVNKQAGANTPLASIISAGLIALTLWVLTPLLYFLPNAVLASVIMVAISGLIDFSYPFQLWRDSKTALALLVVTFIVTIFFSMVYGIVTGIVLSVLVLLHQMTYPHIATVGRIKGHYEFRNLKRFKGLETWDHLLAFRVDASITFINVQHFRGHIETSVKKREGKINTVIVDAGSVSHIDASGIAEMRSLLAYLEDQQINFLLCDVIGPVRDTLYKTGLVRVIGEASIFLNLNEAVNYAIKNEKSEFRSYTLQHDK